MKRKITMIVIPVLLFALCFSGCGETGRDQKADDKSQNASAKTMLTTESSMSADQNDSPKNDKYEAAETIINKIPADIRNEFRISYPPLWSSPYENNERINNSIIQLFSENIDEMEENYGKKVPPSAEKGQTKYYDFSRDYSYVYVAEGAESKFNIDIKTYGFNFGSQGEKEVVCFIGEEGYISTGRGYAGDVNSLIMKYPDHLYRVDAKSLAQLGSPEAKINNYDCAYAYIPDKSNGCDMTFHFRNNDLVYTELYFSLNGCRWPNAEPVRDNKTGNHPFLVETAAEYNADIVLPCNYDVNNDGIKNDFWDCKVDYKIPEVNSETPDEALINAYLETSEYCDDIKQFQSGRYPDRFGEDYGIVSYNYEVHKYKDLCALVIEQGESLHEGGGGTTSCVYYFDDQTGRQISAREYAKHFGLSDKEILDQYNGDDNAWPVDNIYDANFYLDESGKLVVIVNILC